MNRVEKIARHLCTCFGHNPDMRVIGGQQSFAFGPFGSLMMDGVPVFSAWELYAPFVRETIMQIREPSEAMLHAYDDLSGSYTGFWASDSKEIAEGYRAMIDAALLENTEETPEPEEIIPPEPPMTWRSKWGLV